MNCFAFAENVFFFLQSLKVYVHAHVQIFCNGWSKKRNTSFSSE